MLGAKLLLVMVLGQAPAEQADPGELVSRLGAGRYADREAASQALEHLGRPALPALRTARDSRRPGDPQPSLQPPPEDRGLAPDPAHAGPAGLRAAPVTDVVRSLSEQAGFKVALYPDSLPKWKYAKVTLRQPEPVTFWKAIDLLCDAAQLQHHPGLHGIAGPREPTFALTDGPSRAGTPNFDHGPFRVSLRGSTTSAT